MKRTSAVSLYLNVTEYFEQGYKEWQEAIARGDPVAAMPRWVEAHQGNLEAAAHWRARAAELGGEDAI